ncbi:DNA N-6-adenine-methyltransferase [Leadbettera azotonutricia]|uniref:Gp44 n=1 Tax=Leadbettera azotonutricia (strain ATCC BAA-888 / DSM 13862 / ZAS-9) TaxID=545695 RepID=F5YBJ1_LEAAZ|nr:DNA N-6-adenine-methyltransferase [Leadbettera azotonutricia]AEF80906.1 gp44 [Leadbettera azotonutricia ZAS-9]
MSADKNAAGRDGIAEQEHVGSPGSRIALKNTVLRGGKSYSPVLGNAKSRPRVMINYLLSLPLKNEQVRIESPKPHVAHNSGNNEWYTPAEYIEAARKAMGGIDLDPASCEAANRTVKAKKIHTIDDDGLGHPWEGRVWLNPPYARELIGKFIEKLKTHVCRGEVTEAIVLVNNATETAWFGALVSFSNAIVFPASRVKFNGPDGKMGSPLQGQAVLYAGPNSEKFLDAYKSFGWKVYL